MALITYADKDKNASDNVRNEWRDVDANEVKNVVNANAASGGTSLTPTAIKTSSYTAANSDLVVVDASSGNVPITLPTGTNNRQVGILLWNVSGAFTCTVTAVGVDTINQSDTSFVLQNKNQQVMFQFSSALGAWLIIGGIYN